MTKYYVKTNNYYESWFEGPDFYASHRVFGPSNVFFLGHTFWRQNDRLHREDGPALILASGREEYWLRGTQYGKEEYDEILREIAQ